MKRIVCLIASAFLAVPALAALDDSSIRVTTLPNGLVVVLAPDPEAAAADVTVWYRAGTRYEGASNAGLGYLFGRLMFSGSSAAPGGEHRRVLESLGATVNSITNPDYTAFYQTMPPVSIDRALELEAARMSRLSITAAALEAARRSANDEREARLALSPVASGLQQLYGVAFEGHPYARPVIGSATELGRLKVADAEDYHRSRFSPDQAVLTVVGRFDPTTTMEQVRERFGRIARRPGATAATAAPAPQQKERRSMMRAPVDNRILLVGWRGPGAADPDSPAMDALAQVLTGGLSSRVHVLAASRMEFNGVEGGYDRSRDASLVFGVAGVAAAADSDDAEKALTESIEALAREPVSEEELEKARRQIEAHTLFSWQTARGRAESVGAAQLLEGDGQAAFRRLERIRSLAPADLQRVAARVLRPESRSVVWIQPQPRRSSRGGGAR
jgi:zinc protease